MSWNYFDRFSSNSSDSFWSKQRKCAPHDNYVNVNDMSLPNFLSPQLEWNYNRGLSTTTAFSGKHGAIPLNVAVLTEAKNEAFSVAQLELSNEVLQQIDEGEPIKFLTYQGKNLTNQRTTSDTTAVTNLIEYVQDPETGLYAPSTDKIDFIYSLIGLESGQVNLCKVNIGEYIDETTDCSFKVEEFGTAVMDFLYIPQVRQIEAS